MGYREKKLNQLRKKIYDALDRQDYEGAGRELPKLLSYNEIEARKLMVCLEIEQRHAAAARLQLEELQKVEQEKTPYQSFLSARIFFMEDRIQEALDELEQVKIENAESEYQEKLYNLMGQCYKFLGENRKSSESYFQAFQSASSRDAAMLEYSNFLFNLHYLPLSVSEQRKAAEGYQKLFEDIAQFSHSYLTAKKSKLRVGYISPDLCMHVVLRFSYVLFDRYDHDRFEVYLYANNPEDGYSHHLASMVDGWRNILGCHPEEAARLIYEDGIDILVDLAGHTKNNCLPVLAYKPAPVQISGIGYFASTGLDAVDYFLGDVYLDTKEAEEGFTEELLLLPNSHFCYAELEIAEPALEPPCRKNGYITFGSFNNFTKVNDEVMKVWGEILRRLPQARLLLKAKVFERQDNREYILRRMERMGIPLDRVETRGISRDYIKEYGDMDIALDTFPYPGGGTTCDALYMGVPVICLRGRSHGERFGASLLENLGLEELCADTKESYIEKAVGLALDWDLVEILHQNLRSMLRKSPVMNAPLYMESIQRAYEAVWEKYVMKRCTLSTETRKIHGEACNQPFSHEFTRHHHEKIRIGYISPHFNDHMMARFSRAFLQAYDKYVFEVYGYSSGEKDYVTQWLMEAVSVWRVFDRADADEAACQIYNDEIDILIDLSGEADFLIQAVLEYHPAPVQICGIAYEAAWRTSVYDYILGASSIEKYSAEFRNKILSLSHSSLCYQLILGMPSYISPTPCHRTGQITFGCMASLNEITDERIHIWKTIIEQTANSVFVLMIYGKGDAIEQAGDRIQEMGLLMGNVKCEYVPDNKRDYFDVFTRMDILLDTCCSWENKTLCDALYMGVPVITRKGTLISGILLNAGLDELCAESPQEYVKAALNLAMDMDKLGDLHLTLRWRLERTSAMNGVRYMVEVENAIGRIWCEWQKRHCEDFSAWQKQACAEAILGYDTGKWDLSVRRGIWLEWSGDTSDRAGRLVANGYSELKDYERGLFWGKKTWGEYPQEDTAVYQRVWCLQLLGRLPETIELCNRALQKGFNLNNDVCQQILTIRAHRAYLSGLPDATEYYREAVEYAGDNHLKRKLFSSLLMTYNNCEIDNKDLFEKSRKYKTYFREVEEYRPSRRKKHKKLRVGYISPDFRRHVMMNFIYPFFFCYDRKVFEIYVYSLVKEPDQYTRRLKGQVKVWRDMDASTPEVIAERIRDDEIDILFDLAGHTTDSGLPVLAWKPAPVQISGLGYMATTGLSEVDYFLTDDFVDPPGEHDVYFTEQLLFIRSQFCYRNVIADVKTPKPSGAPSRERGWVLFGVFNGYRKITDEMLLAWKEILSRVEGSKLLLKCQVFFAPEMRLSVFERLKKLGFDMDRVILENATMNYMERYLDVDLALDTYPYPGGGTTCDALYMGVPVITRYGSRRGTRFSYGILKNLGLGELAVSSLEEYVERATAIARDIELLDYLHKNLRTMMEKSPVMDAKGYMNEVEAHYHEIWGRYWKQRA